MKYGRIIRETVKNIIKKGENNMKKLAFIVIALSCIFFVGCMDRQVNKKKNDISVDNNNQEQNGKNNCNMQGDEIVMSEDELIEDAKKKYFELYIKPNMRDATINDVLLFNYLGMYHNDCLVGVFIDKNAVYIDEELSVKILDYTFYYSYGYDILVFHKGLFYSLQQSYEDGFISLDDLSEIYDNYIR